MGVWWIVILSVIVGAVANEHPPANPSYLPEEIKATEDSRVLARVETLLQKLSAKMKVLDDDNVKIKRNLSSLFTVQNETNIAVRNVSKQIKEFSISATRRMVDQELKLERLEEAKLAERVDGLKREINNLLRVQNETNKALENVAKQLKDFSITATRHMIDQEQRLKRLQEDKLAERVDELKSDINSVHRAQNGTIKFLREISKQFKDFSNSSAQRMIDQEEKLERLPEAIRDTNEMIKATNKSLTERMIKLEQKLEPLEMIKPANESQRMMSLVQKLEPLPEDMEVDFIETDSSNRKKFQVFRDMTNNHGFGSGWLVFQRRFNGSVDFYRNWLEYKKGFGNVRGEHWLGLEKLAWIVKRSRHELLIVLEDFAGVTKYAHYDNFKIGDENEKYVLKSVGKYTGTAGDSFTYHESSKFSTYDQDNDRDVSHCAEKYKGAWWYDSCFVSHLNGIYRKGKTDGSRGGIVWYDFRGHEYSLKSSKMMVRPVARN